MEARSARHCARRRRCRAGHNPADYVTRRLLAPAADGETVPVSLLYRKDTPLDGSAPLFLYGYGAYGISIPAVVLHQRGCRSSTAASSIAIAHIRGGKDKGYRWYTDGKLREEGQHLHRLHRRRRAISSRRATRARGRIVANGGSAGGMLMGVVANMAPELFLGIIADVPFVDVLNTMLDETLPLTPPEWPEWGNPIDSEEDFEHDPLPTRPTTTSSAKAYPHILAYGGLTDPRVTYWEPAKWVARLRELKTTDNLILLKTNMEAGHGGASGRFEALKEHGDRLRLRAEDRRQICGLTQTKRRGIG